MVMKKLILFSLLLWVGCTNCTMSIKSYDNSVADTIIYKPIYYHYPASEVDTIITTRANIICNKYHYCDFVTAKKFKPINPIKDYMPPFIDALTFMIVLTPIDTLMFSYLFETTDSTKNKREIFYNNIKCKIKRILFKDSDDFDFTDNMTDYRNAEYYANDTEILICSAPSHWTGLVLSKYRFCQLIDKKKNICYEFYLDIDYCRAQITR